MLLEVVHRTAYRYERPVRHSKNELRATPVSDSYQHCVDSWLEVTPDATVPLRWRDYYGTEVVAFDVDRQHDAIEVVAGARVASRDRGVVAEWAGGWAADGSGDELEVAEFLLASPLVTVDGVVRDLAGELRGEHPAGTVGRVVEWVRGALTYERGTTTVRSSVAEVLEHRRGVCQDFAHITCALLRATGVPARYVSGYFAPKPLEVGEEVRVEGHAWVEAHLPKLGWWGFDPTNDQVTGERHVKVGHGRDYGDVTPVRGVYRGGHGGRLEVDVRIRRLPHTDDQRSE